MPGKNWNSPPRRGSTRHRFSSTASSPESGRLRTLTKLSARAHKVTGNATGPPLPITAPCFLLEKVVTTTIFKQDPRYFYKRTGTNRSRAGYAISRTFVCRGDDKKDQFCYSSLINRFGSGFVSNYYYPAADRDKAWRDPAQLSRGYWL